MAPSARIAPSEGEKSGNVSRGSTVSRSDEDAKTSHNVSFPQSLGPSEVQSLRPSEPDVDGVATIEADEPAAPPRSSARRTSESLIGSVIAQATHSKRASRNSRVSFNKSAEGSPNAPRRSTAADDDDDAGGPPAVPTTAARWAEAQRATDGWGWMRKDRTSATEADSAAAADGDGGSPERRGSFRRRLSGGSGENSPVRRLSNSPGLKNLKQVAIAQNFKRRVKSRQSVLAQTHHELVQQAHVAHGQRKRWYVILPSSESLRAYLNFVCLAAIASAVAVPAQLGLALPRTPGYLVALSLSDVLLVATCVVNALTAVSTSYDGMLLEPRQILRHYAKTWMALDLLGALPLDALTLTPELGLLRLLRVRYLFAAQQAIPITSGTRQVRKGLMSIIYFLLVLHWLAMLWAAVGRADDAATSTLSGFSFDPEDCNYACLMYVTLAMLLGEPWSFQGSDFQHSVASVVMLVGALLFAIVFGEIIVMLAQLNASAAAYQDKMRGINESMRAHKLDDALQAPGRPKPAPPPPP